MVDIRLIHDDANPVTLKKVHPYTSLEEALFESIKKIDSPTVVSDIEIVSNQSLYLQRVVKAL